MSRKKRRKGKKIELAEETVILLPWESLLAIVPLERNVKMQLWIQQEREGHCLPKQPGIYYWKILCPFLRD